MATPAKKITSPHWVPLGAPRPNRVPLPAVVHGVKYAVWTAPDGVVRVARDACPHRGASLSTSGRTDASGCVTCSYHDRKVSGNLLVETDVLGESWLAPGAEPTSPPPTAPEFTAPGMRTFGYSKTIAVNPVLFLENVIDFAHLPSVHRVSMFKQRPVVTFPRPRMAEYAYDDGPVRLVIQNEFFPPFTASLRFQFTTAAGVGLPSLLLWFSARPASATETTLRLRVSRGVLTGMPWLTDRLFMLIDELPLLEDAAVVGGVDAAAWSSNALTPDDALVAQYRAAMRADYPDILDAYVK